ncbi:30S ribosomal protein S15 [Helicobacter sp. 11S02629-2]|uniref:30S ribosomal protein S15 n=1 Tax=Helicobacter sp. 11S02629-2 TaxID=1476195 RepID=UPI000BA60080|nr:30S ribosomal protein S15 [Helicobacter sp. 11S02629-2]PAF45654.1 30S ribosomal protein S15 [Helicobacter sp. 11S02629-2]
MAMDLAKKKEIISKFCRNEQDTGSSEVQIALLSHRISTLTEHLKTNKKDHSSRLGLLKLVGQRKSLLRYLKRVNYPKYIETIKALGIKDKI